MSTYVSKHTGPQIDEAVDKFLSGTGSVILLKTLTAASWSSGVQTITDAAILANSPGDLKIAQSATSAQYMAFVNALPQVTAQAAGSITVTCRGTVPTADIPVIVEVRQ